MDEDRNGDEKMQLDTEADDDAAMNQTSKDASNRDLYDKRQSVAFYFYRYML